MSTARTASLPSTTSARPTPGPHRLRARASAVGAWTLLGTGLLHAVVAGVGSLATPPAAQRAALDLMAATDVAVGGASRSLQQLFTGFSLTMAVLLCGLGAVNVHVLRQAPQLFLQHRGLLVIDLLVAVVALVLAVLLLPPPPVVLLALAAVAFGLALSRPSAEPTDC